MDEHCSVRQGTAVLPGAAVRPGVAVPQAGAAGVDVLAAIALNLRVVIWKQHRGTEQLA